MKQADFQLDSYLVLVHALDDVATVLGVVEEWLDTAMDLENDLDRYDFEVEQNQKKAMLTLALERLTSLQEEHRQKISVFKKAEETA